MREHETSKLRSRVVLAGLEPVHRDVQLRRERAQSSHARSPITVLQTVDMGRRDALTGSFAETQPEFEAPLPDALCDRRHSGAVPYRAVGLPRVETRHILLATAVSSADDRLTATSLERVIRRRYSTSFGTARAPCLTHERRKAHAHGAHRGGRRGFARGLSDRAAGSASSARASASTRAASSSSRSRSSFSVATESSTSTK